MSAFMSSLPKFVSGLAISVFVAAGAVCAQTQTQQQLRPLAMVDLPGMPGFDEVVFANGNLVLTHNSANTVDIIDPVKKRMVAQIKNVDGPRGLAVDAQGG